MMELLDFFLPTFCQRFGPFAASRAPTTYLCLVKYICGIVLFAQPRVESIYGFTVFHMENWPQNGRFCIFDLHFAHFQPGLYFDHAKSYPLIDIHF